MLTGVIESLRCERCTKHMHVSRHLRIEISDQRLRADQVCPHGRRVVVCDLPEGAPMEHETTCPRCKEKLLLAGRGFVDDEGFDVSFVCHRCKLILRRVGRRTCQQNQRRVGMLTLADA